MRFSQRYLQEFSLLEYNAVSSTENQPTCRKRHVTPKYWATSNWPDGVSQKRELSNDYDDDDDDDDDNNNNNKPNFLLQ
jgi:hypothetical protein